MLNESGMALVITMGILLLVTLMAVAFFSSQHTEKMASTNYRYGVIAEEIADGYLNVAINMLVEDRDGGTDYEAYDSLYELWGPKYAGGDPGGKRFSFHNTTEGFNLDPVIKSPTGNDEDARWIDVIDDEDRPIGRVAVLVMPENSKVNINTAGNYDYTSAPLDAEFDGYTPFDVSLFGLWDEVVGSGASNMNLVLLWRFGADRWPGTLNDDLGDAEYLDRDKVDNNGNGMIDEPSEGINDLMEYFFKHGAAPGVFNYHVLTGDDFRYTDPKMMLLAYNTVEYKNKSMGSYLTAFSYKNDLIDFEGKERVRLNKHAFPRQFAGKDAGRADKMALATEIKNILTNAGMLNDPPEYTASQLALNIVDYCDYDYDRDADIRADVRTFLPGSGEKPFILGVEKTVYISEVNAHNVNTDAGNGTDPILGVSDYDPDLDYIELINISDRDIDLTDWTIQIRRKTGLIPITGHSTGNDNSTILTRQSGTRDTCCFKIIAVEKNDYRAPDKDGDGYPDVVWNAQGKYWEGNDHAFLRKFNTVASDSVLHVPELADRLTSGSNTLILRDNHGNIADIAVFNDDNDAVIPRVKSWQRKDVTTDEDSEVDDRSPVNFHAADGFQDVDDTWMKNRWLTKKTISGNSVWELKHVKDRYFSSVAEIAKVCSPSGTWEAFINRDETPTADNNYEKLLRIIDQFTIAQEFDSSVANISLVDPKDIDDIVDDNHSAGSVAAPPNLRFSIGPQITRIVEDDPAKPIGDEALVFGRININAIKDSDKQQVYAALRKISARSGDIANNVTATTGYGDGKHKTGAKPYGIGELGYGGANIPIEDFIPVSNLLTTKSNVFKITILAQAYDRKFNVAAERKLEVIVDRGYIIDASAPSYSNPAREEAKQIRVLSYRWVTEEE